MSFDFHARFEALTGHGPFPWQGGLFERLVLGDFPPSCDIPTGLGKTSAIAAWLLALAHRASTGTLSGFPRRLAYVVNRRTVVDQSTRETERMRQALATRPGLADVATALRSMASDNSGPTLAVSTLRGQFADNAEWRDDPARPAVIVGTVDMIGSRLLFSGYGLGFKTRPLHAGFLGQDTLLIHDEAHLEPAFQQLVEAIAAEQQRRGDIRRLRVIALTATSRGGGQALMLSGADQQNAEAARRLSARKSLKLQVVEGEKQIGERVAELALNHAESGRAILVFLRKLDDVKTVSAALRTRTPNVQTLTGTLRGFERDNLVARDCVFARFLPNPNAAVTPLYGTAYLVCTSAGEVGVDISADDMVCDLTPFDSMAQRLGRVNRFGCGDAGVTVVYAHELEAKSSEASDYDRAVARTLALLRRLPHRDGHHEASPSALGGLDFVDRQAAFTPEPSIPPASDILFDAWALTSVRASLPGRPPVEDWLHGVGEWEPPETHVAWREEVERITGELLEAYPPGDLIEDYPLKPHELLRDRSDRVFAALRKLAAKRPASPVWVLEPWGGVTATTLAELTTASENDLRWRTVLLPPSAGGLKHGLLDASVDFEEARREDYDVADRWADEQGAQRRCRVWDDDDAPERMRLVRVIDSRPDAEGERNGEEISSAAPRVWRWYVRPHSADDEGSRSARTAQELEPHLVSAQDFARAIVDRLALGSVESRALVLAARWHDLGKRRRVWQRSIGNDGYPARTLAKSGGAMRPRDLSGYRHELGSLIDLAEQPDFGCLDPEVQDLVQHLIAAHHGRARPHFPADEAFDPERSDDAAAAVARETPRRFARLQRKYGRWGLAYLESLLRAADIMASQAADARAGQNAVEEMAG